MAITFIGAVADNVASGGNVTLDLSLATPTAGAVGDLVIIVSSCFGRAGNEGRIGNALSYNPIVDVTNTQRVRAAWKTYVTSEGSITVEGSGNNADAMTASALILRGHDAAPIDQTTTTATGSSTNPDPPAIVPVSDDDCIVVVAGSSANDSAPGTITNYNVVGATARSDTNVASSAMAYRILVGGAGASQNPAAFSTWLTGTWVAASIAIKPFVATGQPAVKRMGGVKFVGNRAGQNTNLWRKAGELFLPQPSIIRI